MPSRRSTEEGREAPQHRSKTTKFSGLGQLPPEELAGRVMLLRIDCAVPIGVDEGFWNEKFDPVLPTLDHLVSARASVVILTHINTGADGPSEVEAQRMVGQRLAFLLGRPVDVLDECYGPSVAEGIASLREGEALLLGNLALEPAERENDPEFARFLADLCDFYCNEAFTLAHEIRASTMGVAVMARRSLAGLDFERHARMLALALDQPVRPFVTIFGGSLSLSKLLLLESIAARADVALIGGEVSLAFLAADDIPTGAVQVDEEAKEIAGRILRFMRNSNRELLYPQDFVLVESQDLARMGLSKNGVFDDFRPGSIPALTESRIGSSQVAADIGIGTRSAWSERLSPARTIFWHGPLGICEIPPLQSGTSFIAEQMTSRTWPSLHRRVVCGESLVRALRGSIVPFERIQFLSSAGQAILNYAAGRPLPALEALRQSGSEEQRKPSALLALTGVEDDMPLARFAGRWLPNGAAIHCVLIEPGPDEDRYPDVYLAMTKAERLAERFRAERVFARADAALASQGITATTQALIHGNPSDKLIQRARELAVDMIVIGNSAAARRKYPKDRVTAGAPCDVLVFAESLAGELASSGR